MGSPRFVLAGVVGCVFLTGGCAQIPIQIHTESHVQNLDGTVEHKSSDWHGTLDELPAHLAKAGSELEAVTSKLLKELTEVPPPGKVALKDLAPELAKHQDKRGEDFLITAVDTQGKPIKFEYVRIGVPQYDDFFKAAQEVYAIIYETTQVVGQMKKIATKLLSAAVEADANFRANVDKAIATRAEPQAVKDLEEMKELAQSLSVLVPAFANKLGQLVKTGEGLIANAAKSITNPKVVAHLDLVKQGLTSSVNVIKESGSLMTEFAKNLASFKS